MNHYLQQLIEVAEIDKKIDSFEPRITEAKLEVNQVIKHKDKLTNEIALLQDDYTDICLKISKNEIHLEELNKKIEDIAHKWKMIKTEKENKSLTLEEEILKEQVTFANEEIERLSKNKTAKEEEISSRQAEVAALNTREQELRVSVQGVLDEIYKQREEVLHTKNELTRNMDPKITHFYEKIRKWARNTSVVPIYKRACGGCFIRLNDKLYIDIRKSEDIITCPHCGRILYVDENAPEQEKVPKTKAKKEPKMQEPSGLEAAE